MTNFKLSFKEKNKKFFAGQILSGNDIHMTKFSPRGQALSWGSQDNQG
jgi:hypothetical protein